jgi:hypothetical protein
MGSLTLSAIVFAVVLGGGVIGLELQRKLPASYTTGGAKDMTGAVVGLMTLLLALVLGLLIWTAYGVYSTQKLAVQTVATADLKLAEAFQDYGPDAGEGQRILRDGIQDTMAKIWGDHDVDEEAVIHRFGYARAHLKARIAFLNTLKPATDEQTAAKAEAMQAAVAIDQTLSQMTLALVDPISYPLISIVVAVGFVPLLRLRPFVEAPSDVLYRARDRRPRHSVRDLHHRRPDQSFSGVFVVSQEPLIDVLKAIEEASAPAGGHR